jgi:hypothetical protein
MDILTDPVVVDTAIKSVKNDTKERLMVSSRTVSIQTITTTIRARANYATIIRGLKQVATIARYC